MTTTAARHWLDRSQPNALNLLRLLFALAVIASHGVALMSPETPSPRVSAGAVAVNGFFAISGFLITGSWLSRPDSFLRSRVVRIWPGFAAAFIFSVLVAMASTGGEWVRYLRNVHLDSLIAGLFSLNPAVLNKAPAFASSPWGNVVNGSMWTIPIEFGCYLGVAVLGSVGLLSKRTVIAAAALIVLALSFRNVHTADAGWGAENWPRFAAMFASGMVLYLFRSAVPKSGVLALISAVLLFSSWNTRFAFLAMPTAGLYLMFYIAYSLPDWSKPISRIGASNDISYGVYLYAMPLQLYYHQLAKEGLLPASVVLHVAICSLAAICCGWVSWKLIEQPAMAWAKGPKRAPVQATRFESARLAGDCSLKAG